MWLHGFGFPRYRGGLMFWADTNVGAKEVYNQIAAWHQRYGDAVEAVGAPEGNRHRGRAVQGGEAEEGTLNRKDQEPLAHLELAERIWKSE